MRQQLPALKPAKVLLALQRAGFFITTQRVSHYFLKHPDKPGLMVTLPFPSGYLKRRTLMSVVEETGFSIEEFLELL